MVRQESAVSQTFLPDTRRAQYSFVTLTIISKHRSDFID